MTNLPTAQTPPASAMPASTLSALPTRTGRTPRLSTSPGVTLYETKSILFQEWVQPGGAKLVVINPRRDFTAAYAEANGGIHLQLIPGTDTVHSTTPSPAS